MDPLATLREMIEAHDSGLYIDATEHARSLAEWFARGGFVWILEPDQMQLIFECLRDSFETCRLK